MAESYEEKDLFGDDDEEDLFGDDDDPQPAFPSSGSAQPELRSTPTAPAGDIDEELELFGSDDEAKDTPGLGLDEEEKELFGSDDGDEGATPAVTATPISTPGKPPSDQKQPSKRKRDLSEMDERDIFGDISDEELPEKVNETEEVIVRNRPTGNKKSNFVIVGFNEKDNTMTMNKNKKK
eukprot:9686807-Karenia_brevis.AAC.1